MSFSRQDQAIQKEPVLDKVNRKDTSAFEKYAGFFVGKAGLRALFHYEWMAVILAPMPGAPGLLLRKLFYPGLFARVGRDVNWGRNIALRYPGKIFLGDRVGIDDNCLLDASGGGDDGLHIGSDVLIARDSIIQCKTGPIRLGDRCTISSQCQLSSVSGISLGKGVMLGGQCYIGGGRYRTEDRERLIMDQGLYSKGPVVIEDDVWIGAGATVLDGVHIGRGCVVGAGAVIREDLPPYSVVTPYQKLVMLPRG